MSQTPTSPEVARRWVTGPVQDLFWAEIRNEREGGVSPSTLTSTIDSVAQGLPFGGHVDVPALLTALLVIRDLLPGETRLVDLLE